MASWFIYYKKEETGVAPHFTTPLKPQVIEPKQTAVLQCAVVGKPTPTVKWYANNKEIKPKRGNEITYNPETGFATLKILKPIEEDQTIYSVQATNTFGRAECRANLIIGEAVKVHKPTILHAPKITRPLDAMIVYTGKTVTLEAEFEGTPTPEVKWYRNGKEISPKQGLKIVTTQHKTTLNIPKAYKPDGGKYEVRVVNPVGEARSSGSVSVTEPEPELAEVVPPRFVEGLKPQLVAEGEVVILETRVYSHPTCSFQWFQHSVPIKSSPELRIVTMDNRSVLLVNEVLPQHAGSYTCRAENVAGSVTCTATLNVTPETEWEEAVELESPRFVKKLGTVRVMDGEQVELTCQVTGKPTPKVIWFHKNEPVKEAKDVTIYQDSEGVCKLAIMEVFPEDAGEYTCQAINKVGEAVCAASLVVEAYEYVPDSEIASATVLLGQSGSEEDLLAEKETLSEVSEEAELPQGEVGRAPHFITRLQDIVPTRNGELTRLEVKVEGSPKPKVHWYKQGVELAPSKDFQIEELEDGTSVLTITEVFPDDTGEIMCEAQNELGVDTTVTELVVEDILGTKEYRKPEWVTHMEELQEQLRGKAASSCVTVTSDCMREHGSDNDVMSVDSLDTNSVHHQSVPVAITKGKPGGVVCGADSVTSLGDVSIGDDSVFVSNASSCSDDLHAITKTSSLRATCTVASKPFLLNAPVAPQTEIPYPTVCVTSSTESHPRQENEPVTNAASSDFAHLIITDYLNSHRRSITAAIEALGTNKEGGDATESDQCKKHRTNISEHTFKVKSENVTHVIKSNEQTVCDIQVSHSRREEEGGSTRKQVTMLLDGPTFHLHERREKSEEVVEIVYISEDKKPEDSSFYLLSPIQETREPSTASSSNGGSNGVGTKKVEKRNESMIKLLSASCETLSTVDTSMTTGTRTTKYQTFPRSKIPVLSPLRNNACYNVPEDPTMYPLEPRELDPASFNQLHMADSQEELQEFLLLESQCMTTDGRGLAAAFLASDEDQFHSDDEDSHCTMSDQ